MVLDAAILNTKDFNHDDCACDDLGVLTVVPNLMVMMSPACIKGLIIVNELVFPVTASDAIA
jgi:hypothetical protein